VSCKVVGEHWCSRKSRQCFSLSDLQDNVNCFSYSKETFSNKNIRLFLESYYYQDLNISKPVEASKCDMVFLNAASPADMAVDFNFDLQDNFVTLLM